MSIEKHGNCKACGKFGPRWRGVCKHCRANPPGTICGREGCGNEVIVTANKRRQSKFCSLACANHRMNSGTNASYEPTQDEIDAACDLIRSHWEPWQLTRAAGLRAEIEVQVVSTQEWGIA